MNLEMRYFDVSYIQFGSKTSYGGGSLFIDKEELIALLSEDKRLQCVDVELVNPGEKTRITNVLDIVEPRINVQHQDYFPGMHGAIRRAGAGTTNVLCGAAVLEIGSMQGLCGALIDMSGPGASLTPHSRTRNVCLMTEPAVGLSSVEYGLALKSAGLKASVYLGRATLGAAPSGMEGFNLDLPRRDLGNLPRVAYLMQLHSHGDSREPFVYGDNTRRYYPTILHPNEIIDGAIVCGHYNISTAIKNSTYTILNHPVVLGLHRRHGRELNFTGVVISPEPTSLVEIRRTSMMAAGLLKHVLKVDGVIITKEGGGHTDVDLMENCEACETLGIKTVLIDNEWLGPDGSGELPLIAISPKADVMVSVGNVDGMTDLPAMERVVGGTFMYDLGGDLQQSLHIPIRFIPNAISQAGFTHLTTEAR
jgi:glycine reductase complex component B subunit alpha and beta